MDLERDALVLQKKKSQLFVDTAKCLYENAKKWPETSYANGGHGGLQFIGPNPNFNGNTVKPDQIYQEIDYTDKWFYDKEKGFIYESSEDREELFKEMWLYSVYNLSVKNTMPAMRRMRDHYKTYSIDKVYSPFEYCPIPILEKICEVYPQILEELKQIPPFVAERFPNQRKSQNEYFGKVNHILMNGQVILHQICEKYKEEQRIETQAIWNKAVREGRNEFVDPYYVEQHEHERWDPQSKYKDGFRSLDFMANEEMIRYLYSLLAYPFRRMGPFYSGATPYSMGHGPSDNPYWNWIDNIAEVYIEAIECHWKMLQQLIPMRKELEAIDQKIQEEEKRVKNLRNNPLGNNFGLDRLFHTRKSKPKPKRRPRPNSSTRGPSSKPNSPKQNSPPKHTSSMKEAPKIESNENLLFVPRMRGPTPNRSRRPSGSMKRPQPVASIRKKSNAIGFGKSFPRPIPVRMYETNPNEPTPGTSLHAYLAASKGPQKLRPPIRSRKRVNSSNQPGTEKNVLNLQEKYTRNHTGTIKKEPKKYLTVENL